MSLSLTLLISLLISPASPHPDTSPLLSFKYSSSSSTHLSTWQPSTSPCTWTGVSCSSSSNRVYRLVLEHLNLSGPIPPSLSSLTHLRILSLKHNSFSGPLPAQLLSPLKLLFLSHNSLSGPIPAQLLLSLPNLYRLDLAHNSLSGPIPAQLNSLAHLLTLRLESNHFSGTISPLNIPNLQDFNVSDNNLTGEIPGSLSGFPVPAFTYNSGLCGPPLTDCSGPARPGDNSSPFLSKPDVGPGSGPGPKARKRPLNTTAIVLIIIGDVFLLLVVAIILYNCRKFTTRRRRKNAGEAVEGEKIVYSSSPYPNRNGPGRGRMVFFEEGRRFELEDLLRASAEMLGKGGTGTAYKAVLEDGEVVAVKRLRDVGDGGGGKFEEQMGVIGKLRRHENVVGLKAYYYARDEKLIVYEYMPNGSLFWLLHGNRGPGRTPLDWTTRLKIAHGTARGLVYIHNPYGSLKLTHGNIKSTNILIDKTFNAQVSDFGLSMFSPPSSFSPKTNGYRAPESSSDPKKITQKSDVYSFGVLLLEILTGKCPYVGDNVYGAVVDLPRWVQSVVREEWTAEVFDLELMRYKDIEEEMVGVLQIAMACTNVVPDQRPRMSQVAKMIEEIRGSEVSPSRDDGFDSVSDSPSVSEDACGVSQ